MKRRLSMPITVLIAGAFVFLSSSQIDALVDSLPGQDDEVILTTAKVIERNLVDLPSLWASVFGT